MAAKSKGTSLPARGGLLLDNEYVKELLSILDNNGRDSSGLTSLLNHVTEMEAFVKHAENRIAEMKAQLDDIKEVQNHPIKAALRNAIRGLEKIVAKIKGHIETLKSNIIEGCKNAVNAFRETGISALDKLASFFNVKGELQAIRQSVDTAIKADDKAVQKIEAFAKEYHSAGRAFKNMARVMTGKKPIDAKKEAGKLARAVAAPYIAHKTIMSAIRTHINRAITRVEKLEVNAWAKRNVRNIRTLHEKPSIMQMLQQKPPVNEEPKREHRVQERVASKGIAI